MLSNDPGGSGLAGDGGGRGRPLLATALALVAMPLLASVLERTLVDAAPAVGLVAADALELVVALDMRVVDLVLALRHPVLTKLMTSVTGLGSAVAAAVFVGVAAAAGWTRELRVAGVALLLTAVVVATLMALVSRPFPPQPVCTTAGGGVGANSFPSGHAAAVTVYALVARESRELPFGVVGAFAVLVAASRVYLGTHYASDTVVGVGIGIAAVLVARRLLGTERVGGLVERLT